MNLQVLLKSDKDLQYSNQGEEGGAFHEYEKYASPELRTFPLVFYGGFFCIEKAMLWSMIEPLLNKKHIMKWKLQPQEREGEYLFCGNFVYIRDVQNLLSLTEILTLYTLILRLVIEHDGLDYLQVFVHEDTGQKLYFIAQLDKAMMASEDFLPEYNYCTLMLAEEN